ncbi:hypothetical protein GCM10025884_01150 [Leuconostoc gelidum subsp. gelidum]|nr:hypothetical protein GCM10025884_01150 [Leuconostoc gelidum subsp. gelidum]
MPRCQEPKKDGANTEMPRGAVRIDPWMSEWGNPPVVMRWYRRLNA